MDTLQYIKNKYNLDYQKRMPIEIQGSRDKDLPQLFKELGFKKGAEIGVERGIYSETLCENIPDLLLYGIDPWKAYKGYKEHTSQEKLDDFYEETIQRLAPYNYRIMRAFSKDAYQHFKDGELDFVYIDGNHSFYNITCDLHFWIPKVRKGGIISGHDFRRNSGKYVNDTKDVIPAYVYAKKIKPWFVLREKQGASSWFWVKI